MVYVSRIAVYLSMSSVAALSKVGGPVALVGALEAVDTQKLCQPGLRPLEAVSRLQLDLEASVGVFVAALEEPHAAAAALEEAFEGEIDPAMVEVEEVSDIKVEAALVEEVGMVEVHLTAIVTAQHHPLMLLLDLADVEASVVGMVARLSTAA